MGFFDPFRAAVAASSIRADVAAIVASCNSASGNFPSSEPALVYDLFCTKAPQWASAFSKLTGVSVDYGAVFTHQRPYVRVPPARRGPELCDVVLLFTFVDAATGARRVHALLGQAKVGQPATLTPQSVAASNAPQWAVYSGWPKFECTVDRHPRPLRIFGGAKSSLSRARHLLFDRATGKVSCPIAHAPASFRDPLSLEGLVADALAGGVAHRVSASVSGPHASDWSEIVAKLRTQIAAARAPRRQTTAAPGAVRGAGVVRFLPSLTAIRRTPGWGIGPLVVMFGAHDGPGDDPFAGIIEGINVVDDPDGGIDTWQPEDDALRRPPDRDPWIE